MNPGRRIDILRLRLRTLFRRKRVERDLDKELSFHLAHQIDENIARGKRSQADHVEDMPRRGGLIEDDLRLSRNLSIFRFFECKDSADQFIQVVIAHACYSPNRLLHPNPPKQSISPGSALNLRSNRLVEFRIRSLQPDANASRAAIKLQLIRLNIECLEIREMSIREMSIQKVKRLETLA